MKKLLLLPVLAFLFTACSSDMETEDLVSAYSTENGNNLRAQAATTASGCFSGLTASYIIDVANGFGNGTITFISQPPADAPVGGYKVRVEVEQISDCEDLTSGNGNIRTFTDGVVRYNVGTTAPVVSGVSAAQTFPCYRWRMVFESAPNASRGSYCVNVSPWYDAPLF